MGDRAKGGREGVRGSEEILTWEGGERGREGKGTFMESGRRNFMESGRRNFIMGYDRLGSGGGEHSWNQEESFLTWDTTL